MTRADAWVTATVSALQPLASRSHASSLQRYMKGIAPFLGIPAPEHRRAQAAAWRDLTPPSPDEVVDIT